MFDFSNIWKVSVKFFSYLLNLNRRLILEVIHACSAAREQTKKTAMAKR